MRRFRGVLDLFVLVALAIVAAPWCLVAPASWERALDRIARHLLFGRTVARVPTATTSAGEYPPTLTRRD